jgi:hypothetical protein
MKIKQMNFKKGDLIIYSEFYTEILEGTKNSK